MSTQHDQCRAEFCRRHYLSLATLPGDVHTCWSKDAVAAVLHPSATGTPFELHRAHGHVELLMRLLLIVAMMMSHTLLFVLCPRCWLPVPRRHPWCTLSTVLGVPAGAVHRAKRVRACNVVALSLVKPDRACPPRATPRTAAAGGRVVVGGLE